ncbi:MAG: stage III sporulation protein AF [Clostridia bacterium]|nr:stage III sporulation protein AF [Clostridia bacterium]
MEILSNLLKSLLILGVMLVLLESLLPQSTYRPYLKMVGGLLVIWAVLQTVTGLMGLEWKLQAGSQAAWEQILSNGEALSAQNQEQAVQIYQEDLQEQLKNLLLSSLVEVKEIQVQLNEAGQLQGLNLYLADRSLNPIGQTRSKSQAELDEANRLAEQAAAFCGLAETAVQVRWAED